MKRRLDAGAALVLKPKKLKLEGGPFASAASMAVISFSVRSATERSEEEADNE